MGRFLLLLLLLSVSVAARMTAAPAAPAMSKIGIVSAIGDKLYLRKVGVTVFGNESQERAIDSWRIDDLMTAKLRSALAGRFEVRPVTYRRAAFANLENRFAIGVEQLRAETVRAEVSPQGLDAYLIVNKGIGQFGQTNQTLFGLGLVEGPTVVNGDNIYVHAFYSLSMVDGHAWTLGAATYSGLPDGQGLFGPRAKAVMRQVDHTWSPASPDVASNQRLKGAIVELIDRSLPSTLQRMKLVQ
jgi:hypothetical protein